MYDLLLNLRNGGGPGDEEELEEDEEDLTEEEELETQSFIRLAFPQPAR
jgi:hypothetical protein